MVISEGHAKLLIREGTAEHTGYCRGDDGYYYAVIVRYDIPRTDHYYIRSGSREYDKAIHACAN